MTTFSLHELTSRQLNGFLPVAARKKNLIVNEIPADLYVGADWTLASTVVSSMIYSAINHITNSCIRISAKIFGDIIMLHVTDNRNYNDCSVVEGIIDTQATTQPIGKVIGINFHGQIVDMSRPAA